MQQKSCRVELNEFSVELDGRGLKSCARVRRIIYEVPKSSGSWGQGEYPDIWLIHELRDVIYERVLYWNNVLEQSLNTFPALHP